MNRYILIRRLRVPAFLILVGVLALLNQTDILSWGHSWPLFLILAGAIALAERAALAADGGYPLPYPGQPYAAGTAPNGQGPQKNESQTNQPGSSAIVPAHTGEYEGEPDGGEK